MNIGLVYDLRDDYLAAGWSEEDAAEFDRLDTVEAIEQALRELGHDTERVGNADRLQRKLLAAAHWDLVFNIAEGTYGLGREALVPALLDARRIPYTFSDPVVLGVTLHKAMAKRIFRDLGLPTPDFAVVETVDDIRKIRLRFPVFVKPIAEGTGKGVNAHSVVHDKRLLGTRCADLLRRFEQPVLVERYLPGRELTVGIVGTGAEARSAGVLEVSLRSRAETGVYSYTNKEYCEELVDYSLAQDTLACRAEALALEAWRGLGCRDAGRVDLRADEDGNPQLLEINPLAGIHPQHSDLPILWSLGGGRYVDLIAAILESAARRLRPQVTESTKG